MLGAAFIFAITAFTYALNFRGIPLLVEYRQVMTGPEWPVPYLGPLTFLFPIGENVRPVSWDVYFFERAACSTYAPCHNWAQILFIAIGATLGFAHAWQVSKSYIIAFGTIFMWACSYPVFSAALWQATQHDKLAFVFMMAALICNFAALQSRRPIFWVIGASISCVLALNSKEIAFSLLPLLLTQALYGVTLVRNLKLVAAPVIIASVFISSYMLRLTPAWRSYSTSGDPLESLYYFWSWIFNAVQENMIWNAGCLIMMCAFLGAVILAVSNAGLSAAKIVRDRQLEISAPDFLVLYSLAGTTATFMLISRVNIGSRAAYDAYVPAYFAFLLILAVAARYVRRPSILAAFAAVLIAIQANSYLAIYGPQVSTGPAIAAANNLGRVYEKLREIEQPNSHFDLIIDEGNTWIYMPLLGAGDGTLDTALAYPVFGTHDGSQIRVELKKTPFEVSPQPDVTTVVLNNDLTERSIFPAQR